MIPTVKNLNILSKLLHIPHQLHRNIIGCGFKFAFGINATERFYAD